VWRLEGGKVVGQVEHRGERSAGSVTASSSDSPCSSDGLCCPDIPVETAEETSGEAYDSVSDGDELAEHDEDSIYIDWVSHAVTPLMRCGAARMAAKACSSCPARANRSL